MQSGSASSYEEQTAQIVSDSSIQDQITEAIQDKQQKEKQGLPNPKSFCLGTQLKPIRYFVTYRKNMITREE